MANSTTLTKSVKPWCVDAYRYVLYSASTKSLMKGYPFLMSAQQEALLNGRVIFKMGAMRQVYFRATGEDRTFRGS